MKCDKDKTVAKRILLVDDEPSVGDAIKMLLQMMGYKVDVVETVDAALLAFDTGRHDLIITDFALGARTGLDLAKAIRNQCPEQAIILISAYVGTLEIRKERLMLFDAAISKPFSMKELQAALATVFPDTAKEL
jgi:DNA-binding response OmpR family regulator